MQRLEAIASTHPPEAFGTFLPGSKAPASVTSLAASSRKERWLVHPPSGGAARARDPGEAIGVSLVGETAMDRGDLAQPHDGRSEIGCRRLLPDQPMQ